jgi:hypothetical protein
MPDKLPKSLPGTRSRSIVRLLRTGWVARAAARPHLAAHLFGSSKLFADDTPIPVLDPGRGRARLRRLCRQHCEHTASRLIEAL